MSRPVLLLLPGLLCDEAAWAPQARALAEIDCLIPGYGLASSIGEMARLVLEQVPPDRNLCVAGHSMGGRVALEVARLAPARVERLALLDTGYKPRIDGPAGDAEKRDRLALLDLARERGMREMARRWAAGMVHPKRLKAPLFEEIVEMVARKTPDIFQSQIQALLDRPDGRPVLASLRCPTLLVCGRQDTWSPLPQHQEMQALIKAGAELVVIEDSGHMTTMEQPEAVAEALRRWMQG